MEVWVMYHLVHDFSSPSVSFFCSLLGLPLHKPLQMPFPWICPYIPSVHCIGGKTVFLCLMTVVNVR